MKNKLYWDSLDFRQNVHIPPQLSKLTGEGHWGSVNPERMACAIMIMKLIKAQSYMEIGVNKGNSLHYVIQSVPTLKKILAFDLCNQDTHRGWGILKKSYNIPMKLICGDTLYTLNTNYTGEKFDIIHIDGGHSHQQCYNDIIKSKKWAHPNTIVIIDDAGIEKKENSHVAQSVNNAIEQAFQEGIIDFPFPGVCSHGSVFVQYT